MARTRMVTRTINQVTAEVMTLNVKTAEVSINSYTIGGKYEEAELLEKLKGIFETEEVKLVHIESVSEEEVLLGMTEDEFIRNAKVLPPRSWTKDSSEE